MSLPKSTYVVIGASGLVGQALVSKLPAGQTIGTYYSLPSRDLHPLDICDVKQVEEFLEQVSPKVVFLPAALTAVDLCEGSPDKCKNVNVQGTIHVASGARRLGAKVVYFSTDYVFDGRSGPYREDDQPRPINNYGQTKLAGEFVVAEEVQDYLIVRTSGVYGWETRGKNFVMSTIDRLRRGEGLSVPDDQYGSPTYVNDLAGIVLALVESNCRGIFHVAGSQTMSRYSFTQLIGRIFGFKASRIQAVQTSDLKQVAERPRLAGLCVDKTVSVLGRQTLDPEEGLTLMKLTEGMLNKQCAQFSTL